MKRVLLALMFAHCVGCSTVHDATASANSAAATGAVLLAVGVALQTDVAGIDSPKTGNIRNLSEPVNTLYHLDAGTWRRSVRLLTNR